MNSFRERLLALGYSSYRAYLHSDHWRRFRRRYRRNKLLPQVCLVCERPRVTLHHVTYRRLGEEQPTDVVPLCWHHHKAVHRWLDRRALPVTNTSLAVNALKARLACLSSPSLPDATTPLSVVSLNEQARLRYLSRLRRRR